MFRHDVEAGALGDQHFGGGGAVIDPQPRLGGMGAGIAAKMAGRLGPNEKPAGQG